MTLFLITFVAGILTVLAPCVLPLLPVIVGGSLTGAEVSKKREFVVTNKIFPAKSQIELAVFFKQVAKADKVKMVLVKE